MLWIFRDYDVYLYTYIYIYIYIRFLSFFSFFLCFRQIDVGVCACIYVCVFNLTSSDLWVHCVLSASGSGPKNSPSLGQAEKLSPSLEARKTKMFCIWLGKNSLFVGWLLNVPARCECILGMDLLRQFYVLPHWDRSCRSNCPSHPVTIYWHQADQSQHWPYIARRLAGWPLGCQFLRHWYDSTPEKSRCKQDSNPGSSALFFFFPLVPTILMMIIPRRAP